MKPWHLICMVLAVVFIAGCNANRVVGDSIPATKEQAIAVATKESPLRKVTEIDATPPGPRMWVIYGVDTDGHSLAVWVQKPGSVHSFTYLDHGVSKADAVAKVKEKGYPVLENIQPILLPGQKPTWYVFVRNSDGTNRGVLVDLATGEVRDPTMTK